ncbi:MAG: HSP90 family protein [Lachnospiraceae bacterium]|nr:HSP90 family protein [Lachnospiraceae bacterium]MCM1240931.1 HSP90 family protein [Lachnospiraceae bacterium]
MGKYQFKVDLKGIIRLLSDNLYSSDQVFLRELLQNAADAVTARKRAEGDFTQGRITVTYRKDLEGARLTFTDNGIGLDEEEIHSFLSVIGQSSKRAETVRSSYIGQFGIGLLSCFLVTNEIKVITRSAKEEKGHQWVGKSDGSYAVTTLRKETEVGTQVQIGLTGSRYETFTEQEIVRALSEYGFLLTIPIVFDGEEEQRTVNDNFIPWRQPLCMAEDMMSFGEQVFEEDFFDVIPLTGEGIKGYAFLSTRQSSASVAIRHKIYLKNMFVTEDGRDIIPRWAFFTRCIIDAEDLTPNASREGFTRDGKLMKVKNRIEKCIFDYFVSLSQYNVRMLKTLLRVHNVAIKSLVVENEQIFKLFFPFLTFPTNSGVLTGFQLVEASKKMPVHYCADVDDFRRICPLLAGTDSILVNGGYIYDARILQRLQKYYKNVRIAAFDENSYDTLLADPPGELAASLAAFLGKAGEALAPLGCSVSLKHFSPAGLQALYVPGGDMPFAESMDEGSFSGFFENFDFGEEVRGATDQLYLNSGNSLVKSLGQVGEEQLAQAIIRVIYGQALLAGHYTLAPEQAEAMNAGLRTLMEYAVRGGG